MIELPCEADILCPAEKVFDLIIDFRGQDRWLTTSQSFHGTTEISRNPVALGTTYREPGPLGVRDGTVTEFERPTKLTFHQPMKVKLGAGVVDVTVRYTLTRQREATRVRRVVTLGIAWPLRPVPSGATKPTREGGPQCNSIKLASPHSWSRPSWSSASDSARWGTWMGSRLPPAASPMAWPAG